MTGGVFEWDDCYAHVIASTGWTWADVDDLTIPRYLALLRYWKQSPPIHMLVAAYMGFKGADAGTPKVSASPVLTGAEQEAAIAKMMSSFQQG